MMGAPRIVFTLFLLLASSTTQQDASKRFKVEGNVVNSVTGKPVARALVQMSGYAVLTGIEGQFSFKGVWPGTAQIFATKPGYFAAGEKMRSWSLSDTIDVGPDTGKVVLKLAPEAVIFGRVSGAGEEPLEGASISVVAYESVNGRKHLQTILRSASTDEDGSYSVGNLAPGRYYVDVRAGNVVREILDTKTAKANEIYPTRVYYPGSGDLASATPFDLLAGQRKEASFSLALGPGFKLAGNVVASGEWKQIYRPAIVDDLGQEFMLASQFDAQSGRFEFGPLAAGTYTVRCSGTDAQGQSQFSDRTVTVSQPVTNLALSLKPWPSILVKIRNDFNQPYSGSCTVSTGGEVRHSDCSDFPAAQVELVSAGPASAKYTMGYQRSGFTFRGVPPGKYVVHAKPPLVGYVESLRSGQLDLLEEELVVPQEGDVAPIEVVVRDDAATVKVRVRSDQPGRRATVLIISEATLSDPVLLGVTASELQTGPLAPGAYKVLAFDSVEGLDSPSREALTQYLDKAASVTVSANESASVVVDVIHTGE
jgi:hypothetical protein